MKTGKTLTELAQELDRQANAKRDFIAPVSKLTAAAEPQGGARVPTIALQGHDQYPLTEHCHGQVAAYTEVPKAYYDRMRREAPDLWAASVNRWLDDHQDESRMTRILDGRMRALLSDRFRPLENFDLAQAVIPAMMNLQYDLEIRSCEVTDRRMYIKAVDRNRERAVDEAMAAKGWQRDGKSHHIVRDIISPAISISNSEVGAGTLTIAAGLFVRACTNLAIFEGGGMRKYHLGKRAEVSDDVYAMLTDQTRATMDEAIWLQARDVTKAAFDDEQFDRHIEAAQVAAGRKIEGDVVEVVTRAAKQWSLTGDETSDVMRHLIEGGDLSQWGLHNAVTRASQDVESYDRASDLERLGGTIIELPQTEWQRLAA